MKIAAVLRVSFLFLIFACSNLAMGQDVIRASGATNIAIDSVNTGGWIDLSGPTIRETAATQLTQGETIILTLPSGYEWNTAIDINSVNAGIVDNNSSSPDSTIVIIPTGANSTALEVELSSISSQEATFTVVTPSDVRGKGWGPGRIEMRFLQIRPTTTDIPDVGTISNTGTTGPDLNYGDLSKEVGAIASVSVETAADGSGETVPSQNISAGNSLTVYSIARDMGGNFIENVALNNISDWSLINLTGNVTQGALSPAGNLKSATFSSQATGSANIQVFYPDVSITTSDEIIVVPRSAKSMSVAVQPSDTVIAGEIFETQPVIHLLDQFGNLVTTDNSTQATISINSGYGTLSGTLVQTADAGVITYTDLSTEVANNIVLKVESNDLSSITTSDITVEPNDPVDLLYLQQPTNTAQNMLISPQVETQLLDAYGNYSPVNGLTVNISVESYFKSSSIFSSVTDEEGIAIFDNLAISDTAQVREVDFSSSFSGILSPVTTNPFQIISADELAKFVIETTSQTDISDQTAGDSFSIRIRAIDGTDNTYTSFEDTVRITADANIQVNGDNVSGITTGNFVSGVFDTTITLTTSGLTRLYAENEDINRSGRSNQFSVLPSDYDDSTSTISANPTEITADGTSTSTITVQLKDQFGNNLQSGGETIVLSTDAGTFNGGLTSITANDAGDGTYTADLKSSSTSGEVATVTGTVNSIAINDSATVEFSYGEVASFVISIPQNGAEPDTQMAGVPFPISIEAVDAVGNRVESFSETLNISTNSVISNGSTVSVINGIASNHAITLTEADDGITLSVSSDNLFGVNGSSEAFSVIPNQPHASTSEVIATPSVLLSDPEYQTEISIILRDEFGNRVRTQQNVTISLEQLELEDNPSSGTPNASATSVSFHSSQYIYTATLTATNTVELIEVTSFFGDSATEIIDKDTIDIVLPKVWSPGGGPGTTKTDWTNENNWEPVGVPEIDDYVVIPSGPEPPVLDLNITVGSFEIQSGASLILYGANAIEVAGNLRVDGSLNIEDNTDIIAHGGFIGSGSFSAGMETTINVSGNISISNFFARTTGSIVTLDGNAPQTISSGNLLAQNLHIENDVNVAEGTDLLDLSVLNIANNTTFELNTGAGITIDVETEITGDGNFILNDNTFVLRGNSDLSNVDASEGTVIFGIRLDEDFNDYPDLSQQTFNSFDEMNNATINNTEGVRALGDVIINGTLTLQNGPLIIESGNALIAPNISYNNGFLRMNRNISANSGWRMISSPVSSTFGDLLDKTVTQGYSGSSLGNAPSDSLQPNVLWYLENYAGTDNQRWRAPSDSGTNLVPGQGLFVYFFGDVAGDSRYNTPLPLTIDVDGQENDGDGSSFTFPITYTVEADSGWNLIGNPFAATIDWDSDGWTKTNVDNVLYVWDPSSNDYLYWNGVGGGDLDGEKLNNGKIKPFQAFWVKANADDPVLKVTNSSKTTGGSYVGKRKKPAELGFLLEAGNHSKSMHITLSPDGKTGKDHRDAFRLLPFDTNTYLEFYTTLADGTELAINNLARDFGTELSIPIHVGGFVDGNSLDGTYTISWPRMGDIPESWTLILIDKQAEKEVDLREESSYSFNLTNSKGKIIANTLDNFRLINNPQQGIKRKQNSKARFFLKIIPGEDADGLPDKFELYNNYPNPFNSSTTFKFALPLEGPVSLSLYDILGRKVVDLVNKDMSAGYHEVQWNARSAASGVYFARLEAGGKHFIKKLTLLK